MQCQFIKSDHERCNAQAMRGKELCFTHDPGIVKERNEARRNGGLARRQISFYAEAIKLTQPTDVLTLMETVINGVLTGTMPASQPANTIGFLARCWMDAYEKTELKNRLDSLEAKVESYVGTTH